MSNTALKPKEGMLLVEESLFSAASWLKENGYSRLKALCSGSGGNFFCDDVQFFRPDVGLVDVDKPDLTNDLVRFAISKATWDWGDGAGGEAVVELYDDGRYSITGGRRADDIIEADPVFGSVTDAPASPEPGKLPIREWVVVGRIPEEETEAHCVEGRNREEAVEAFIQAAYANESPEARENVIKAHGQPVFISARRVTWSA